MSKITWQIDVQFLVITMALIHSYFVDIFLHGKLLHSSASRTHVTIYDVKKCQQNTRESMPNCIQSSTIGSSYGTSQNMQLYCCSVEEVVYTTFTAVGALR